MKKIIFIILTLISILFVTGCLSENSNIISDSKEKKEIKRNSNINEMVKLNYAKSYSYKGF